MPGNTPEGSLWTQHSMDTKILEVVLGCQQKKFPEDNVQHLRTAPVDTIRRTGGGVFVELLPLPLCAVDTRDHLAGYNVHNVAGANQF